MRILFCWLLLSVGLATWASGQGQELSKAALKAVLKEVGAAEKALSKGLRKGDPLAIDAACERLVRVARPEAAKALTAALIDLAKMEDRVAKKLSPFQKQRARLDKAMTAAHKRGARSAESQLEKLDREAVQLNRKMLPFSEELRTLGKRRASVAEFLGKLLRGLEENVRVELVRSMSEQAVAKWEPAERLALLEAVGSTGDPEATKFLIERMTAEVGEDFLIRVLDVFSRSETPGSSDFAIRMLAHDSWFVRAAAVAVLAQQRDLNAVPVLIDALGRDDGRLEGDIQDVLTGMTGVDYKNQPLLWRRWWAPVKEKLRSILERLDGDQPVAFAAAMDEAAEIGFLLGADRILQSLGLTSSALDRKLAESTDSSGDGPKAANPGETGDGVDSVSTQRSTACEAIGRSIRNAHRNIRDQAVQTLILDPLRAVHKKEQRRELLQILADVQCSQSFQVLGEIAAGSKREGKFSDANRAFAIRALADGRRDQAVAVLAGLMDRPIRSQHGGLVLEALEKIESHKSVDALLGLAGRLERARKSKDAHALARFPEELRSELYATLDRLCGQEIGPDAEAWQEWWRQKGSRFSTEREKADKAAGRYQISDEPGTTSGFYGIPTRSKRLCFILDVSGSMNGATAWEGYEGSGGGTKISVAKKQIVDTITGLPEDAWFSIIIYSSGFRMWKPRLVQASAKIKVEARAWVQEITAGGATNIFDPLSKAFELAGRGAFDKGYKVALDTIFFMSDGQATSGLLVNPQRILEEIQGINTLKRVKVNAIGVGPGHDAAFMRELARITGGVYRAR